MASNTLASLPARLSNPDSMTGKDFKAKTPSVGADSGKGSLFVQTSNQECPGDVTGKDFKESKNTNEGGTSLGYKVSVDFGDGMHTSPDQK